MHANPHIVQAGLGFLYPNYVLLLQVHVFRNSPSLHTYVAFSPQVRNRSDDGYLGPKI